ncbi:dipicolinate synthase subunit DpsA [Oscillibacter sp.]|uniref:dipicolinate synthase subunit DpsA n=1 Tax=Oscillibacter sp. TaxID=1945593 RepID=UPI0028B1FC0B|nr:dipicolinate synthase subunit DpsA [Oscillibacter sp.]
MHSKIAILGGDMRQVYIAKNLIKKGYSVCTYHLEEPVQDGIYTELHSFEDAFKKCQILICPIPLTKNTLPIEDLTILFDKKLTKDHVLIGGAIPKEISEILDEKKIVYYDLMKNEKVAILNAVATAEGSIAAAIQSSVINLHGSKCLVLGYGRCAKVLAGKLKGLNAIVTVASRTEAALAYANAVAGLETVHLSDLEKILPNFEFIFNTIPSLILDKNYLTLVRPDVVIIDIASAPGGIDYEYAVERGLNAKLCLGLPGKTAPKISADILEGEILEFID